MRLRLWLLSDLHCEYAKHRDFRPKKAEADLLVVAGDVMEGDVVKAISIVDELRCGMEAIYVPGNHEHWGFSFEDVSDAGRAQAKRRGIHYLDGDAITITGVKFAGAAFWSGLRTPEDSEPPNLTKIMTGAQPANFSNLPFQRFEEPVFVRGPEVLDRRAKNSDVDRKHEEALAFLVAKSPDVVVTHHPPTQRALKALPAARLWVHGHIHDSLDEMQGRTRVVRNPRGSGFINPLFRKDLVLAV